MEIDYYAVLQLNAGATHDEVHSADRAMAMRYHPDRNSSPEAASTMARINEAYAVLGEPTRRRRYDKEQRLSCTTSFALPILAAARQTVLKYQWNVLQDDGTTLLLEQGKRRVRVSLVERLTNETLRKLGRQYAGFAVVLAVEVEKPINLSLQIAVIDLLHSVQYGAGFPDEGYRVVFELFLGHH